MKATRKRTLPMLWRGAWATLRACWNCIYSFVVLLLAATTLFAAYVATLDSIPVPAFLLRQARDALKEHGLAIELDGARLRPNGAITISGLTVRSLELDSAIAEAQLVQATISLPSLLIGRFVIDELKVARGSMILPPVLSPSGLPETIAQSVDLEAERRFGVWDFKYANAAFGDLRICVSGPLKQRYLALAPKRPENAEQPSIGRMIASLAPKLIALRKQIARADGPVCIIELGLDPARFQTITLSLQSDGAAFAPHFQSQRSLLTLQLHETKGASLEGEIETIALPQDASVANARIHVDWVATPTVADWRPRSAQAAFSNLSYRGLELPATLVRVAPQASSLRADFELELAGGPIALRFERDESSAKEMRFKIEGSLAPDLPQALNPLASTFAKIDLTQHANLEKPIDLSIRGALGPNFRPEWAELKAQAGRITLLGAGVDRAAVSGNLIGPQIDFTDIRVRSGLQSAEITAQFNLDTFFRRFLVEGNMDPGLINGWFKPWWAAMWEGMSFSQRGLYVALDSRGTFLKPETSYVTGIGLARDMNLRGIPVDSLRLRFFSLYHYVDLYDIDLTATTGEAATGETQFTLGRDLRDDKDKLTGLWIDVDSTLDVMRGPTAIPEIGPETAAILAPYEYDKIPRIKARSASVRRKDLYNYDVNLDIQTDAGFRFYGFPFQSLDTFVHLRNEVADIPNAKAKLANGLLEASAFIVGDGIDLDLKLTDAGFGETLLAANTYFAANGSASAAANPPQKFLEFGGKLNADFRGDGLLGSSLRYRGEGSFSITDANLVERRLLGPLSAALEVTPLVFTTLKFDEASGPFVVEDRLVRFPEAALDGPIAQLKLDGSYDLATDELNFKARLFPFLNTNIPLISTIINLTTQPLFSVIEFSIKGTFDDPKISFFSGASSTEHEPLNRDHRPIRR